MNCSRFETLLTEYLEGGLEPPAYQAAHQHLEGCPECTGLVDEVRRLKEELAVFPSFDVPRELVDGILDRTSGRPRRVSGWKDVILPALQPFLTQRYTFATVVMFAFMSLMVNLIGPEFSAFSYSNLKPSALIEEADRLSSQVYKRWLELNQLKIRIGEEIRLLQEDLYGRLDYHLVTILFRSYSEALEEQSQQPAEPDNQGETQ